MKSESTTALADGARVENQLVTFQLGNEEFGFNIMSVQEIIRPPKLAKVPRTPDYVDGVANLRGVVLPVIDTRTRFGMKRETDTDRTRVLVIDIDGAKTGLRVDRVRQVTRVASGDIEPPPSAIRGMSTDFLDGVVKLDNGKRIIMALKPSEVCRIQLGKIGGETASTATAKAEQVKSAQTHAREETEQLVTFKLAREEFAFPIDRVREILRVEEPKEVPDTPEYILGVLTVRGRLLPIIDLRGLLRQTSLAEELISRCDAVRASYDSWAAQLKGQLTGNVRASLAGAETLKEWLNAFTSSNQTLMETMAQVRGLNERVIKAVQHMSQLAPGQERLDWFEREVQPLNASVLDLLRRLVTQVRDNIKDDQRIIVVDSNGTLLGLVVDHVNEVLNISRECIDPPPRITCADGLELSGIAKLDKGGRLIMLLDASQILRDKTLLEVQKLGDGATAMDAARNQVHAQHGKRETDEQQLVTFLLGEEEYGIPISQIQEIDRCAQITKVPKAAHFVEGVTNLRGEVIPVIDTRKRFDLPARQADDRTRIIIADMGGVKTGLLVDSVREVLNITRADIAAPPAAIESGIDNRFISGIGKVNAGKRMVVLLDIGKILSQKEQAALNAMSSTPRK